MEIARTCSSQLRVLSRRSRKERSLARTEERQLIRTGSGWSCLGPEFCTLDSIHLHPAGVLLDNIIYNKFRVVNTINLQPRARGYGRF